MKASIRSCVFLKILYISQLEQLAVVFWIILQSDFSFYYLALCFMCSDLAVFRVFLSLPRRYFQSKLGDVGNVSILHASAKMMTF